MDILLQILGYTVIAVIVGVMFYIFIRMLTGALKTLTDNDD